MSFAALETRVEAAAADVDLLTWLAVRFRYFDAATWHTHLTAGRVLHNGDIARGDERLAPGDRVAFTPVAAPSITAAVLFADADLVAVDKPAGAVVQHVSAFAPTFVPALAADYPAEPGYRLEPAHRLDRATSGVLLLARTRAAFAALQRQFAGGTVEKRYVAVVHGVISPDVFRLDGAIGPASAGGRARHAVVVADHPGARPARTDVTVLARAAGRTLVELRPHTGRTHQLRVHLAHAGHPIVGDPFYGPGDDLDGRLLLHAEALACDHPQSGARLGVAAPRPAELAVGLQGPRRSPEISA
ncbi:MAG: RluA family pseudouridine synthase [Planctomycetes bacterium]|nr:RluA family pseudouridine synthase [Planctomycetota bacterium]